MTSLRATLPLLILTLAAIAGGCQSQKDSMAPSAGAGDPWPAPLNDPQITVLSPELQPWLRFQPARIDYDERRPMAVEVPVRNLADEQYLIAFRILFYDANDLELEPTMGWQAMALHPKEVARLKANALSPEAVSYRVQVKWAQ